MPTFTQLLKPHIRITKYKKDRKRALNKCPQKKGACLKVYITTPKKPNSAKRKVAKVYLTSNKAQVIAYIDGIGHSLQKHGTVLVRGGRRRDLPGVRYRLIRGKFDLNIEAKERGSARSKYGQKFPPLKSEEKRARIQEIREWKQKKLTNV